MKVRVRYRTPQMTVDEIFTGATAEEVITAMQRAVGSRVNFALRLFVNAMTPLAFAQEVVRRYNDSLKRGVPIPQTCAEFLLVGETEGILSVLEK